ncbi:probable DNA primase large subunit isoform X2 [Ischnura elegans]|nr:probable DNA primase large subunit isoform X2 [Ischnura elegans]XP_046382829.1 probable DNA primase large subunit isoform X2 [Ischnura elegans]XP_046382830.1 probable DNA primase large subunit isoform X2 [Ischnura elegans]
MIQTLHRHLQEQNSLKCDSGTHTHSAIISQTCSELLQRKHLKHAFDKSHAENCREYVVIVDFQYCSSLVRRREVDLKSGKCYVHCGVWGKLLICFFRDLLSLGMEDLARSSMPQIVSRDIRLKSIVSQTLETFYRQSNLPSQSMRVTNAIKSITVDKESQFFPPCALNILKNLRHDHRLGHHARIQFSLFLKGIGLDVEEAIKFWREEYSKTPNCNEHRSNLCQHAWKKDNSRYIYNIKHLYGLKGSCKDYQSKSCLSLQSTGGKTGEGCPFVRMHPKDIVKVLPQMIVNSNGKRNSNSEILIEHIVELTSKGKPSEACKACFNAHYAAHHQTVNFNDESVFEDIHPKRENAFFVRSEPHVSEYGNYCKNECHKYELEGTTFDDTKVGSSSITDEHLNDRAASIGHFTKGLAVTNDKLSLENVSPDLPHDIEFNCPTQYYFSLKSRLLSQTRSVNSD